MSDILEEGEILEDEPTSGGDVIIEDGVKAPDELTQVEEASMEVEEEFCGLPSSESASFTTAVEFPTSSTTFSFATFWNWFNPTGMDVYSPSVSETLLAYGARSFLYLATIGDSGSSVAHSDLINVFAFTAKKKQDDPFRSVSSYITTVVFDKRSTSGARKNSSSPAAQIFVGTSEGQAGIFDWRRRVTLVQDVRFAQFKRPCCKAIAQRKVISAAWHHLGGGTSVVFYATDVHVVRWDVELSKVEVLHNQEQECDKSKAAISCLASSRIDKNLFHLAVGHMGGKVLLYSFHGSTGQVTNFSILTDTGHGDDICSLAFAHQGSSLYRQGLLASVSRNAILKVWCCDSNTEMVEYRITSEVAATGSGRSNKPAGGGLKSGNWFAVAFLPKVPGEKKVAYELIVSSGQGDLFTITVPEKVLTSKLRVCKPNRFSSGNIKHSSIIFSMATDFRKNFLVTISLDLKLIAWSLEKRTGMAVLNSFQNGAFCIDLNPTDKRVAVAFGSGISILDFAEDLNFGQTTEANFKVLVTNLNLNIPYHSTPGVKKPPARYVAALWNRPEAKTQAGQLVVGNSSGDIYNYDIGSKTCQFKLFKGNKDSTKIYRFAWAPKEALTTGADSATVLLSLHKSGQIMANWVKVPEGQPGPAQVSAVGKFFQSPSEGKKACALAIGDDETLAVVGNDDGTVDVFTRFSSGSKLFKHRFRFRAFAKPVVALELCNRTKNVALTQFLNRGEKGNHLIACYSLKENLLDQEEDQSEEKESEKELKVKNLTKVALAGHLDRVAALSFSPFNEPGEDGQCLLVSGSYDSTCIVWDVTKTKPLKIFFGHRSLIYSVRWCHFNPSFIFSAGEDNCHFWCWTSQTDFGEEALKAVFSRKMVQIESLKNKFPNPGVEAKVIVGEVAPKETKGKKNFETLKTLPVASPASTSKSLFPLCNQAENNSTRYETLDDIKWLYKMSLATRDAEAWMEDRALAIPDHKLKRLLIYGTSHHVARFLDLEREYHRKAGNVEAEQVVGLFANPKETISKALEEETSVDLFLVTLASGLGDRALWRKALEAHTNDSLGSGVRRTRSNAYSVEMAAMLQLYGLHCFEKAATMLTTKGLYREAIILAQVNRASRQYVEEELYHHWAQHRLASGNVEGAVKCLLACHRYEEAARLIEQRRTLSVGMANASVLKLYDEISALLNTSSATIEKELDEEEVHGQIKRMKLDEDSSD